MSRFETEPHALLRPYISSYRGFVRDFSQMRHFSVTPDCFAEVLFFVDPPSVDNAGTLERLPACTLIPVLVEPLRLTIDGVIRCVAIRMHGWAAGIIFPQANVTAQAWFDVAPNFADVAPRLTDALQRNEWAQITTLLDATLLEMVANAQPTATASTAQRMVRSLTSAPDGTTARVGDVAASHGLSRRQVERHVRSLTNRSPKQLLCLRRFQFVRDTLWARPDTELDNLAIEAGYADQAHLTRHFRRYAAQTPSDFKRDCARLRAFLSSEDVAFVQDGVRERG